MIEKTENDLNGLFRKNSQLQQNSNFQPLRTRMQATFLQGTLPPGTLGATARQPVEQEDALNVMRAQLMNIQVNMSQMAAEQRQLKQSVAGIHRMVEKVMHDKLDSE